MKTAEITRALGVALACIAAATMVTSCGKDSIPSVPDPSDKGETAEIKTATVEAPKEPTLQERYEAEFKRLVAWKRQKPGEEFIESHVNDICHELIKLPKEEALPLLDKLLDMAIAQPVTGTDYHLREGCFDRLCHVVLVAFCESQFLRKESFEHWDKLFLFFKKYTDEIAKVEESMPPPAPDNIGTRWGLRRGRYLLGLKGDLKQHIHVMRRFYYPQLNDVLTEEQKADILRRFEEVEKFAAYPPDSPCGRNERGKK